MNCLTKLFQQKRRRIGYIQAFSGPMISKRDSSVGGYVFDIPIGGFKTSSKAKVKIYQCKKSDKCYPIYPIFVPGDKNVKCIVFDFRCLWTLTDTEIKNEDKYKLWFKAKPGLFADVLQKFSSHASRLGLNDIHLERIK